MIHVCPKACTTCTTFGSLDAMVTVGTVSRNPPHAQCPHASGLPQVQGSNPHTSSMWHSMPVLMDVGVVAMESRLGNRAPMPSVGRSPSPCAAVLCPVRRYRRGIRPSCSASASALASTAVSEAEAEACWPSPLPLMAAYALPVTNKSPHTRSRAASAAPKTRAAEILAFRIGRALLPVLLLFAGNHHSRDDGCNGHHDHRHCTGNDQGGRAFAGCH